MEGKNISATERLAILEQEKRSLLDAVKKEKAEVKANRLALRNKRNDNLQILNNTVKQVKLLVVEFNKLGKAAKLNFGFTDKVLELCEPKELEESH